MSDPCLTLRELSLYFAGGLDDDAMRRVDLHILDCPFCQALSERVASQAEALIDAESLAARPLAFLYKAASQNAARIERWVQQGAGLAVGIRLAEKGFEFIERGLEALTAANAPFRLAEAVPSNLRGDGPSLSRVLVIPADGNRNALVVVDPAQRTIAVQIEDVPANAPLPLAALWIASDGTDAGQAQVQEMRRLDSSSGDPALCDLLAEFTYPQDAQGDLTLVLEPAAA